MWKLLPKMRRFSLPETFRYPPAAGSATIAEKHPFAYVVYPAALLDGWEVVRERDDDPVSFDTRDEATSYAKTRAEMDGGALVKLENWYGDTEAVWEIPPRGN
jgi:hypothetical protein